MWSGYGRSQSLTNLVVEASRPAAMLDCLSRKLHGRPETSLKFPHFAAKNWGKLPAITEPRPFRGISWPDAANLPVCQTPNVVAEIAFRVHLEVSMDADFSWRKTTTNDLSACLKLHPAKNGAESIGNARALKAWQELLGMTHASRSAVIERCSKDSVEIAGFGFATFVKKGFAEKEVRNPKPGLNGRILENIGTVVATYEEVRDANTRGDLEQVILDVSWKHGSLSASEVDEVRVMLGRSYQELYAGYHFSRILFELVDALDAWHVQGQRNIRILDRFEACRLANPEAIWNSDRALAAFTVESMRDDPHSIAAGLFQHRHQPQFGFTCGEQQLLEVALEGMDDTLASQCLFVTVPALKRRWANIFERVAVHRPDLCPPDGDGTRGIQKRQRVLAYVRHHPEELRPFAFSKAANK
jgi:hypothetical protein